MKIKEVTTISREGEQHQVSNKRQNIVTAMAKRAARKPHIKQPGAQIFPTQKSAASVSANGEVTLKPTAVQRQDRMSSIIQKVAQGQAQENPPATNYEIALAIMAVDDIQKQADKAYLKQTQQQFQQAKRT